MYKYVALIGCVGVVLLLLLPGLRSFDADSGRSDFNPPRSVDDAKDQQLPPGLTQLSDQQRKQIQRNAMTTIHEYELVDGTVAREWGTFIEAKDIRTNCRDVPRVMRRSGVSQPEDFERVCDIETVFDHPYSLFSEEQLRQIASYDAEAAYLLSYRMLMQTKRGKPGARRDKETLGEALSYAMRSVILTGEKQAFALLIDGRKFPNWGVWSTINGVPEDFQVAAKAEEYKWLKAGRNLGFIEEDDLRWILVSRQVERYKEYFDLEELDAQAAQQSDGISTQRSIASGTRN